MLRAASVVGFGLSHAIQAGARLRNRSSQPLSPGRRRDPLMPMPHATVTIVNYNTSAKLRDCLASIRDTCPPGLVEVVVVDNGSKDDRWRWCGESSRCGASRHRREPGLRSWPQPSDGRGYRAPLHRPQPRHDRLPRRLRAADRLHGRDAQTAAPVARRSSTSTGTLAHSGHHDFTLASVAANAFNVRALLPPDRVLRASARRHAAARAQCVRSARHAARRGLDRRRVSGRAARGVRQGGRLRRTDLPQLRGLRLVLPDPACRLAHRARAGCDGRPPDAPEQGAGLRTQLRRALPLDPVSVPQAPWCAGATRRFAPSS